MPPSHNIIPLVFAVGAWDLQKMAVGCKTEKFRPDCIILRHLGFFPRNGKLLKFLIRRMTYLNKKLPRNLAGASERKKKEPEKSVRKAAKG